MNFYGYKRPDGRVGVRNKVLILPASVCASDTTRIISQQVVGSVTFNNQLGCSQVASDQQFTMDVMAGYAANPNVYGTVVVSLGCENCQMDLVVESIKERTNKPLKQVIIQEAGGTLKAIDMAVRYAKEMGCEIKLLGVARCQEDGVEAYVCPMLIPSSHPLASVNDSYNAVFVNGDAVENAMFYGRGAGELPTASAVVGDLFEIVRNIQANCCARIGCTCYKELPVKKMADTCNRYFMRLIVEDRCGVLAEMTAVFAKYGVSVAQIIQKAARAEESAEVVVITAKVREGDFRTAMEELSGRSSVRKISSMLRVYGE